MKNHFYGINRTANINLSSIPEDRNILSFNNNKLQRQVSGVQSAVATRTIQIQARDPRLTGEAAQNEITNNFRRLNQAAGGGANVNVDPEVANAVIRGEAFDAKVQLNAPDRRNLAITGLATLIQLGAAIATGGNSGFNKEQGDVLTGRASADADFVTKYGNKYDRGFLGIGAQYQDATITLISKERPQIEAQIESKKVDAQTVAIGAKNNINRVRPAEQTSDPKSSNVESIQSTRKLSESELNSESFNRDIIAGQGNGSIDDNASIRLAQQYLTVKNLTASKLFTPAQAQKVLDQLKSGETITDKNTINNLNSVGFSVGTQNGGGLGAKPIVTSILATKANLSQKYVAGDITRAAAEDFLKLANTAGVISDEDLKTALLPGSAAERGKRLSKIFDKAETALRGTTDLREDHFIGGQHITNLQFALNERIKQNTDAADQIDSVVNGKGGTITDTTAEIFNKANGTNLSASQLQTQLSSGNLTGVTKALDSIEGNIKKVTDAVGSVAGGIYATKNNIFEANLTRVTGKQSAFSQEVNTLRALVKDRQEGGKGNASVDGVNVSTGGSIAERANALNTGTVSDTDKQRIVGELAGSLANQLKANGINASQPDVQAIVTAVAKGDTSSLTDAQASILARGTSASSTDPSLRTNFLALVNLEKPRITTPASSSGITLTVDGKEKTGPVADQAQRLTNSLTPGKTVSDVDEIALKSAFTDNLKGSVSSLAPDFNNNEIESLAKKIGSPNFDPNKLEGKDKDLYDKIKGNANLVNDFKAVGTAFNTIDSRQAEAANPSSGQSLTINPRGNLKDVADNLLASLSGKAVSNASSVVTSLNDGLAGELANARINSGNLTNTQIGDLAKKVANGETASLVGPEKELFDKIKANPALLATFSSVGKLENQIQANAQSSNIVSASVNIASNARSVNSAYNDPKFNKAITPTVLPSPSENQASGNALAEVTNVTGVVTPPVSSTTLPKAPINPVQPAAITDNFELYKEYTGTPLAELNRRTEANERNNTFPDEQVQPKNKLQAFAKTISDLLDNKFIPDADGKGQTLSDAIVNTLLKIADEILSKAKANYSYGWGDSAGVSTSIYNGSKTPLQELYAMTKAVGVGLQNGIKQSDKYLRRRNNEKEAENETVNLRDAAAKFSTPETKPATDTQNGGQLGKTAEEIAAEAARKAGSS